MIIRFFLSILLASAMGTGLAAARPDGDVNRPVIVGKLHNTASTGPARTATQIDVNRLKRLETKPSVKCARIEYIHQCLSSQNMTLVRSACRAGSTEASCCKAARDYVNSRICGPVWDRFKKAGKTYYPGIWLCKCIEQPRQLRLKERPVRPR